MISYKNMHQNIKKLLDPNNQDNIIIEENNIIVELEQIALINYEDNDYVIMHPTTAAPFEAIVFLLDEENKETGLTLVTDELELEIFNCYYELLEQ